MLTVLLTDGEFTGMIRALRMGFPEGVRIVGLSENPLAAHRAMSDAFYTVPSQDHPDFKDQYFSILRREKVDFVFPIVSEGLEFQAEFADEILQQTGARVLSSPLSALHIANDKRAFYSFLHGHPVLKEICPVFYPADTVDELFEGIRKITDTGRMACIKRCRGENAAGFWKIDDSADMSAQILSRPLERLISTSALAHILQDTAATIPPYIVCEYLPGEEWDCDVLAYRGQPVCTLTRINLQMNGGLTGVPEVRSHPKLVSYCDLLTEALSLSFASCISFKADADGTFKALEINPRMMGNVLLSAMCGNNYPRMSIDLAMGNPVSVVPFTEGLRTALYYDQIRIPDRDETQ